MSDRVTVWLVCPSCGERSGVTCTIPSGEDVVGDVEFPCEPHRECAQDLRAAVYD